MGEEESELEVAVRTDTPLADKPPETELKVYRDPKGELQRQYADGEIGEDTYVGKKIELETIEASTGSVFVAVVREDQPPSPTADRD